MPEKSSAWLRRGARELLLAGACALAAGACQPRPKVALSPAERCVGPSVSAEEQRAYELIGARLVARYGRPVLVSRRTDMGMHWPDLMAGDYLAWAPGERKCSAPWCRQAFLDFQRKNSGTACIVRLRGAIWKVPPPHERLLALLSRMGLDRDGKQGLVSLLLWEGGHVEEEDLWRVQIQDGAVVRVTVVAVMYDRLEDERKRRAEELGR